MEKGTERGGRGFQRQTGTSQRCRALALPQTSHHPCGVQTPMTPCSRRTGLRQEWERLDRKQVLGHWEGIEMEAVQGSRPGWGGGRWGRRAQDPCLLCC